MMPLFDELATEMNIHFTACLLNVLPLIIVNTCMGKIIYMCISCDSVRKQ